MELLWYDRMETELIDDVEQVELGKPMGSGTFNSFGDGGENYAIFLVRLFR